MDIDKREVGKRIKEIRKSSLKLTFRTMEELADKVGSNKSNVSRWERGINLPSRETLEKIADIGGISVNELLHGNVTKANVMNDFIKYLEDEINWRKESIIGFENAFVEGSRSEAIRYAKEYIERKLGGDTHD